MTVARRLNGALALAIRLVLAAGGVAALYAALLSRRTDYPGHFLAGFGGTLAVFVIPLLWIPPDPERRLGAGVVWILLASIAIGAVLEATVFRIAAFDPLDFVNQSLGAVLASAAVLGERPSGAKATVAAVVALAALQAGFLLAFA